MKKWVILVNKEGFADFHTAPSSINTAQILALQIYNHR
jgi:hypothetical protein